MKKFNVPLMYFKMQADHLANALRIKYPKYEFEVSATIINKFHNNVKSIVITMNGDSLPLLITYNFYQFQNGSYRIELDVPNGKYFSFPKVDFKTVTNKFPSMEELIEWAVKGIVRSNKRK